MLKRAAILAKPMDGEPAQPKLLPNWHSAAAEYAFHELEATIAHRRAIAKIYHETLPANMQLRHDPHSIYLRFPLLVDDRAAFIAYMRDNDIHIGDIWYDAPVSPKRSLVQTNYQAGSCPHAEYFSDHMVNLPTNVNISERQAKQISERILQWLSKRDT